MQIVVASFALLASGWACERIGDDYSAFATRQNAAYEHAKRVAAVAVEQYAQAQETITVRIENPTGGTASFYVGTVGAKADAAPGVNVDHAPERVSTLPPHARGTISVSDWFGKYIRTVTTYSSLSPERAQVVRFADMTFTSVAAGYFTSVLALPNLNDFDYQAIDDIAGTFPAIDVQQNQFRAVAAYRATNSVNRAAYDTGVLPYLGSTLQRLRFP